MGGVSRAGGAQPRPVPCVQPCAAQFRPMPQTLLERLAGMEAELKANTEKKERLEAEIELCSIKLKRAVRATQGQRWDACGCRHGPGVSSSASGVC
jgi:hypothetical protein